MKNNTKCGIKRLFGEISKMWTLQIIREIYLGNNNFNAIKKELGNISSKTLSERLKELQESGFIERNIVSEQPIKIEYHLTKKGKCFSIQIDKLNDWANKWGY